MECEPFIPTELIRHYGGSTLPTEPNTTPNAVSDCDACNTSTVAKDALAEKTLRFLISTYIPTATFIEGRRGYTCRPAGLPGGSRRMVGGRTPTAWQSSSQASYTSHMKERTASFVRH